MPDLTDFQRRVLARLEEDTARIKHGDGPWERAFQSPRSPAESRAMARLYKLGMLDRDPGGAKIPHRYRVRA